MAESAERILLRHLLESRGKFLSGNDLAGLLGVSRVSVWGCFERLRAEGFRFSAVRNRGYRLEQEPDHVFEPLLYAYLDLADCKARVHCLKQTDSTNYAVQQYFPLPDTEPVFVGAAKQSAGRGRLGRAWFGEESGNLYLTLGVCPKVEPARMRGYTLWLGLQLCRHMGTRYAVPLQIKWPNDLMCQGRKIAGILTEMHVDADTVYSVAFGLGFNVNGTFEHAPERVQSVAGSLHTLTGQTYSINAVAAEIIQCLVRANTEFFADLGWKTRLSAQWGDCDVLAGKRICARGCDGVTREATAMGITQDGGLSVRFDDGTSGVLEAGDVTLSDQPPVF